MSRDSRNSSRSCKMRYAEIEAPLYTYHGPNVRAINNPLCHSEKAKRPKNLTQGDINT